MIEQALFRWSGERVERIAHSPGFSDDWLPTVERLCAGFGRPSDDTPCPECVFAQPFGRKHVAVVQVAGAPSFRFLVLPMSLYASLDGDLFRVADAFPPPWAPPASEQPTSPPEAIVRDPYPISSTPTSEPQGVTTAIPPAWELMTTLPSLEWTAGDLAPRTVAEVRKILDVPNSPTLLGSAQALLDGGRVVFERTAPDAQLVRSLWGLLPGATRAELWPTTFAYSNDLEFHIAVVPRANGPEYERYVTEDRAGDYPEGRYELALQFAAESENQEELNALFSRRSRGQMFRLAVILLILFLLFPLSNIVCGPPHRPQAPPSTKADNPDRPPPKKELER